jgi:hypothetical protein
LCPMLLVSIFLCLVSNVTLVYLSLSCVQCYPCLSFCVLCPMLSVSIFLCLVPNVIRIYLSVSCAQCYSCLSFFVLCPTFPVSIFLCLVPNFTRVYLSLSCAHCSPCLFRETEKDQTQVLPSDEVYFFERHNNYYQHTHGIVHAHECLYTSNNST